MRVLLLVRHFDFGGAENHVLNLANSLYCSGHSVILVSQNGQQVAKLSSGIIHYQLEFSSQKTILYFFRILQIIHRHQIEIVHAHQRLPLIICSALARFIRIPVIGTIHSLLRQDVKKKWVRKGLKKVIVVSENSYTGTQKDPILKNKSIYIPNGIAVPDKTYDTQPQKLHFYYISRLDSPHSKLVRFLLNEVWPSVLQKYPEAKLSIVGDGLGMKEIKRIIKHIRSPKVLNSVFLKGYAPKITSELTDASLVFGVGRVAMESMSVGIPVLSIKSNRLGPIITGKNFEKLKYGNFVDIEAVAPQKEVFMKIIDDFTNNQDYYKKEAIKLSRVVIETFKMQTIIQSTLNVYNESIPKP